MMEEQRMILPHNQSYRHTTTVTLSLLRISTTNEKIFIPLMIVTIKISIIAIPAAATAKGTTT